MTTSTPKPEFFRMGGRYEISADSAPEDLADDSDCLLDLALKQISVLTREFGENLQLLDRNQVAGMLHSVEYLLQMARNTSLESSRRFAIGGRDQTP